mgnify:CR=1 FL=1
MENRAGLPISAWFRRRPARDQRQIAPALAHAHDAQSGHDRSRGEGRIGVGVSVQDGSAAARQQGFAWVSSSLLYSRYQPHEVIKAAGERLSALQGAPGFAYDDFRVDWQEGIDRSKDMELYRQPYCGCVYSESDRYQKQLLRCIKG